MVALRLAAVAAAASYVVQVQGLEARTQLAELSKPKLEKEKHEKHQKGNPLNFGQAFKNMWNDADEEHTTPAPTWNGLPLYYKGKVPDIYWTQFGHMQRQDFFFRIERWHDALVAQQKNEKCRAPKFNEKVVYFVQHGDAIDKQEDAQLWELGLRQVDNVRYDPELRLALSQDPKHRVQTIIVSPARKALQSAVLGFGDIMPDAKWEIDADVRGFGWVEGTLIPKVGEAALYELAKNKTYASAATNMLKQYRALPGGFEYGTKPHKDRWFDFVENLAGRPEKNFIVITHGGMIKQANISKTHAGEVNIRALLPDKTWRKLSPPDCWPVTY